MATNVLINFIGDAKSLTTATDKASTGLGAVGTAGLAAGALVVSGALLAGKALLDIGTQFDDAFDKIRINTGKTGPALDGLEQSFKNVVKGVPSSFDDTSTAIAGINQKLDLTGKPLEDTATRILNLTRITGGDLQSNLTGISRLFQDWSIKGDAVPGTLDKLYRASQATGIGIDDLTSSVTQFGAPLRGLGYNFDESITMLAKWQKEGVNTEAVTGSMKKAFGSFSKEFGDKAPAEFRKFIDEIAKAPSASAAAQIAIKRLGVRNGPDFAAAVKEGRFAYNDLLMEVAGGSDTINTAAADTDDWHEKLDILKNKAFVALEPVAVKVFDALGRGIDELTRLWPGFHDQFLRGVDRIKANVQTWADRWRGFVADFKVGAGKVSDFFDSVHQKISDFVDRFQRGAQRVHDVVMSIWNVISPLVMAIVGIITGAFEIIIGIIQAAWKIISGIFIGAFAIIWGVVGGAFDVIVGLVKMFSGLFTGNWEAMWNGIKEIFSGLWLAIQGILSGAWTIIFSILSGAWTLIKAVFVGGKDAIVAVWTFLWGLVKGIVGGVWDGIVWVVGGAIGLVIGLFKGLVSGIADAGRGMWDFIADNFKGVINTVIRGWNALDVHLGPWKIPDWIPLVGGKTFEVKDVFPDIPYLAAGGVMSSPTLAVVGDTINDSEIVSPTKLMRQIVREEAGKSGGGISIGKIEMHSNASPADLASELHWLQLTGGV